MSLSISVFITLIAALAFCMLLGSMAKNFKSAQTLTFPVVILALIPMFLTMFKDFDSLKQMYYNSLKEFYRILEPNGILVVKCQDYTDSKTTFTHCLVYNWAIELGFYAIDLFILLNNSRIDNRLLEQRVSRKCHSYFWVFKKCNIKNLR